MLVGAAATSTAAALQVTMLSESSASASRRNFLQQQLVLPVAAAAATALLRPETSVAAADDNAADDPLIDVYLGCGCFWHVQHEFVEAERRILGRTSDLDLTARAGYAGGTQTGPDSKVCYHNAASVADYGKLGHAEVVALRIPASKFKDFCLEYCNLFSKEGYRPDQAGDRGSEYRNLVGVPGGVDSVYARQLVEVSSSQEGGDKLDFAKGKGNDPDRRSLCFIMDTAEFPFYMGEQYHQFHDGFNFGENYPASYNNLANKLAKEGKLGTSNCPNGLLGIGALGL